MSNIFLPVLSLYSIFFVYKNSELYKISYFNSFVGPKSSGKMDNKIL